MARHLLAQGLRFRLAYFCRSAEHVAFRAELANPVWGPWITFHLNVAPDDIAPRLRALILPRVEGGHVYVCGPRPFIEAALAIAGTVYPADSVHREYFGSEAAAAASGGGFVIRCARSGHEVEVGDGESAVTALRRVGIEVDVLCEQGVCGTCLAEVLEGVPEHRDSFLTDAERAANDRMLLCCSRAQAGPIVLDL
jgi:vanillate O-demethylase ferredoxin subunit